MKTTISALAMAFTLAACSTYGPTGPVYPTEPYPPGPPPGPPTGEMETYRAIGTEPFWDLRIAQDMVFTDRGTGFQVVQPTPQPRIGVAGETYETARIRANIVHSRCSDGMSDRTYPDTVTVWVDNREYRGCGADPSFFTSVDERGNPVNTGPAVSLDRTRWRVVAINGRPTPPSGDFSMQFDNGRLGARFGCNSLGAGYTQNGSTLDAGAVIGTRMACQDSFERDGLAVLNSIMTIAAQGADRIRLSSNAGSIDLARQ